MFARIREFAKTLSCPAWRVSGVEVSSGRPVSMLFFGSIRQNNYLIGRIFRPDGIERRFLGRRPLYSANFELAREHCSLAVFTVPNSVLPIVRRRGDITIPLWVEAEIDCGLVLGRGATESLRRDLKRIPKFGLTHRCSSDLADVEFFYHEIYLPTIERSHGDAAMPSSPDKRKRQFEAGTAELILVEQSGQAVGGVVIDHRNELPALRDIGVLHGDYRYKKQGVITAANYYAIRHLFDAGYEKVSMGLSRGFLNDGVFGYKTKWSPRFFSSADSAFLFRSGRLDETARTILRSLEGVSTVPSGLSRIRFVDDAQTEAARSARGFSHIRGLTQCAWYELSGDHPVRLEADPFAS